jgi:protein-tyrosine phosphatase
MSLITEMPFSFPGRIYRSPMPFSRYDRLGELWNGYLERDVDLVVLLVEPQEYLVFAGRDLPAFYLSEGLDVLHIPVPDFGVPRDLDLWMQGLAKTGRAASEGKNVVVHCLAGLGRTGTFLACLAREELGLEPGEAICWVRDAIPGAMENLLQEDFIRSYHPGLGEKPVMDV